MTGIDDVVIEIAPHPIQAARLATRRRQAQKSRLQMLALAMEIAPRRANSFSRILARTGRQAAAMSAKKTTAAAIVTIHQAAIADALLVRAAREISN